LNNAVAIEVVVSLVGGGFAVLVALIGKIGHDNRKDHGVVHNTLGRIEQKIDGHLEGHK
jgi:predicted lysophospholipase L1 biosynthesis ABC-type transport system permease subunit